MNILRSHGHAVTECHRLFAHVEQLETENRILIQERDAIEARTVERCKNVALKQRHKRGRTWENACVTIAEMIRALPLTLACSAAMWLGYLIGAVVTG